MKANCHRAGLNRDLSISSHSKSTKSPKTSRNSNKSHIQESKGIEEIDGIGKELEANIQGKLVIVKTLIALFTV